MLKRFVTYIYQYDRGNRGQNTGFVKADIRDAGCRIQIQLRGLERFQGTGRVYLIVSRDQTIGIPAGEFPIRQGLGQLKLAYAKNQLGASGYSVSQVQAVVILCSGGKLLASCWSEHVPESVLHGKFNIWGETTGTEGDTVPAGADESAADTELEPAPESVADTDLGPASEFTADHAASVLTVDTSDKPADTEPATETASVNQLTEERSAQNANPGSMSADDPASDGTVEDRIPEDAPALGIVDAPASPDETLIDFGVTAEEISAEELQTVVPPPLSLALDLPDTAEDISQATDIPAASSDAPDIPAAFTDVPHTSAAPGATPDAFIKSQGDWAQVSPPFSSPSGDSTEGASCPCQNQAPSEQHTQPGAPGQKAEAPEPMPEPPTTTYKKIAITDIRTLLPKRNWYLCSNSFLIHGFFNYHYLILKTVEYNGQKKCYLGVPGIYEQPERTMAFMFGFPNFEPAHTGKEKSDLASEATDIPPISFETGVFGYWMLQLMDER